MDEETKADALRRIAGYLDVDPTASALGALIWHFLNRGVPAGVLHTTYNDIVAQRIQAQPDSPPAPIWDDVLAAKPRTGLRFSDLPRAQGDTRLYGGKPTIFFESPFQPTRARVAAPPASVPETEYMVYSHHVGRALGQLDAICLSPAPEVIALQEAVAWLLADGVPVDAVEQAYDYQTRLTLDLPPWLSLVPDGLKIIDEDAVKASLEGAVRRAAGVPTDDIWNSDVWSQVIRLLPHRQIPTSVIERAYGQILSPIRTSEGQLISLPAWERLSPEDEYTTEAGTYLKTWEVPQFRGHGELVSMVLYLTDEPNHLFLFTGHWRMHELTVASGTWVADRHGHVRLVGLGKRVSADTWPVDHSLRRFERIFASEDGGILGLDEPKEWSLLSWRGPFTRLGAHDVVPIDHEAMPRTWEEVVEAAEAFSRQYTTGERTDHPFLRLMSG